MAGGAFNGDAQTAQIEAFVQRQIDAAHRETFLSGLQFDLDALIPHRVVGMGITQAELALWQKVIRVEPVLCRFLPR